MGDCKITAAYSKLCSGFNRLQGPFLLIIRLYWGIHFMMAGWGKLMNLERTAGFFADLGIPFSGINAGLAGVAECGGGLLLALGLASRLACIPLIFTMIVAYATAHYEALVVVVQSLQGFSIDLEEFIKQEPYTYLMAAVIVLIFGPGKFSVDYLLKKKFS